MAALHRLRLSDQLPEPISHYADAVVADGWIWISGTLPLDASGAVVGGSDVVAPADRVHESLQALLEKAWAGFEDVVNVTVSLLRLGDRATANTFRPRIL